MHEQVSKQARLEAALRTEHFLAECDASVLEVDVQLRAATAQFLFDLLFDLTDSIEQLGDPGIPRAPPADG
jgi:hypothetical protein